MPQPLEYSDAWDVHREATIAQRDAEDALAIVSRDYSLAEEAYRKALAAGMWRLRQMDKDRPAWTVCGDLSRGDVEVARLKRIRDEKEGERTIAQHAVYRRVADRRDTERFIEWSMKRDLAEGFRDPVPSSAEQAGLGPATFAARREAELGRAA